ncbi:MAG: rhodanese-like domain-containing protein, partial [Gammaproteobacteria bacterium]|nr:rhodanese-like domain-containing protein [Gammaproteobacteria bacterium]
FQFVFNHPILVGVFLTLLVLFIINEVKRSGKSVSTQQLVGLVNNQGAVVIDLRDPAEYATGHIVDALNIPYTALQGRLNELQKYKEKPVLLACKMGQHSGMAGTILKKAGFLNVSKLKGGYAEWQRENLPLVKK